MTGMWGHGFPTMNILCGRCQVCHNAAEVEVPTEGYWRWRRGEEIQTALPELDADQRELLLTGTHAHCWERMFGGDDAA